MNLIGQYNSEAIYNRNSSQSINAVVQLVEFLGSSQLLI